MYDFSNKAILVTGSTRGIGLETARLLLKYGATVGIHGRDLQHVKETCLSLSSDEKKTIAVHGDFTDPDNAKNAVNSFAETAGGIDGLINNAGGGKALAFRAMSVATWRKTMDINLTSAMMASREAYILMRGKKSGVIINIASVAGQGPGQWMGADYAAGKAGIISLTKSLAFEAARFNIRVNAVSPGFVETDMTMPITPEQREKIAIPMGRFARAEEIASAVCFLISDDSSYITGQVLNVNGGYLT